MNRPRIIIDIAFNDGTYTRGIIAHSMDFDPNRWWQLKIYINEADVHINNPMLFFDVNKVEVVGYIETDLE